MKTVARMMTIVLLLGILVPVAHAAPLAENYCFPTFTPDRCLSLMQLAENWAQRGFAGGGIGLMKGIAQAIWLLDRAAAYIFTKSVVDNGWLMNLKNQMASLFASLMPGLIRDVAFGSGGLMYVALAIAGLLMMVPLWGAGARFVRAERVMVWGVILSVLFVGGTFGYDFVAEVEGFRQRLVSGIVQGASMPLDNLIQQPMLAGAGDMGFGSDLLALPPVFDSTYFPAPQLLEITISEGGGFGFGNALIEPEWGIRERLVRAGQGVFYAVVSGFGAWLLLLVGFTYVVLAFTALILIVFLFAALPLGFFEIGGLILTDILGRYFQVTIHSLTLAVFLRWLSGSLGYIVDVNNVPNALTWVVVMVVMSIVTGTFLNGSLRLLTESGRSFGRVAQSFGGPPVVERVRSGVSSAMAQATGLVTAGALLTGRPDVAAVSSVVGAVVGGQARARIPPWGYGYRGEEIDDAGARGNVFADNGMGNLALATALVQHGGRIAAPSQGAAQTATQSPQTAAQVPQAALQAISARQMWDAVQVRQVEEAAKSSKSVEEAVARLQKSPGFERANSDELRRAVEAARVVKA